MTGVASPTSWSFERLFSHQDNRDKIERNNDAGGQRCGWGSFSLRLQPGGENKPFQAWKARGRERERERVVVTRLWRPKLVQEEQVSSWTQPLGIRIDLYIRSPDWRVSTLNKVTIESNKNKCFL